MVVTAVEAAVEVAVTDFAPQPSREEVLGKWTLKTREDKIQHLEKLVADFEAPHDPAWRTVEDQRGPPHFAMLCAASWAIPFLLKELRSEFARGQDDILNRVGALGRDDLADPAFPHLAPGSPTQEVKP